MSAFFRNFSVIAILSTLLLLMSCGMASSPRSEFSTVNRNFVNGLRWMNFAAVATMMDSEKGEVFLQKWTDSKEDLHITDVRMEKMTYSEDRFSLTSSAVIEYYRLPSTLIRKHSFDMHWIYEGHSRYHLGEWKLVSDVPPCP